MAKKKTQNAETDQNLVNKVDTILAAGAHKGDIRQALGKDVAGPPNVGRLDREGKTKEKTIVIPKPLRNVFEVAVMGMDWSSLVQHRWGAKAIKQMLGKHMNLPIEQEEKDPFGDFIDSMERDEVGMCAVKSIPFKNAMMASTRMVPGVTYVDMVRTVQVLGDFSPLWGLPTARMDPVNVGPWNERVADLRFRCEFKSWLAVIRVQHDPKVVSIESLLHLLTIAGSSEGVSDWRPEKGGNRGMFEIVTGGDDAVEQLKMTLGRYRPTDITLQASGVMEILKENHLWDMYHEREMVRAAKNNGHEVVVSE